MAVAPVYPVLSEMKLRQVHEEISVADSELTMAWRGVVSAENRKDMYAVPQ